MSTSLINDFVVEIGGMDLEALRHRWGQRYGAPPPLRSMPILRMLLAWRVQAEVHGALDAETRRLIELARHHRRTSAARVQS